MPPLNSPLKNKPDVYYIFFDELMQTDALRECLQYDNSLLDTALTRRGFFVASESKSAYHATPFSIASAFRSSVFIEKKSKNIHLLDYLIAYKEIQQNLIIPFLIKQGYSIRNFAHYKLFKEESQAMFKDPSYDTRQLVLNQTFSSLIVYLIEGVMSDRFSSFRFHSHEEKEQVISTQKNFINKYQQIIKVSKDKREKPVFVHGHFFAPHLPVYFDSTGKPLNDQQVNYYKSMTQSVAAYKINLAYTRKLITNLVDEIMKNTNYQAVIIIQSDHGYRGNKKNPVSNEFKFQNFTALYYPDQEYKTLDKKFYLPNTFRYLLNKFSKDSIRLIPPEYIQLSSRFLDD